MIADAAKGWLDVDTVRLRYRVEREGEQDADLLMYNTLKNETTGQRS